MGKQYDVVVLGPLCGCDYLLAGALNRLGLHSRALRPVFGSMASGQKPQFVNAEFTTYYSSRIELLKILMRSRCVVSFTMGLMSALGKMYPARFLPGFPKVINWATGSDMSEVLGATGAMASWYRFHLKTSSLNIISWQPVALRNVIEHRVPNAVFVPMPHLLSEPACESSRSEGSSLLFFHPSHLDWKICDPGDHRYSSKGNDRFLSAFIRAVKDGLDAKCVILDRGPDKDLAKEIIKSSGVEDHFIWKQHMSRDEYHQELQHCDVVVDQFDIGLIGGVGIEAMSAGKPVIIHFDESANRLQYRGDLPPILNAHGEEQIYQRIMECRDRAFLDQKGKASSEWAFRNHHWSVCLDSFLFHYSRVTGHVLPDAWTGAVE